jgi:hypothetical protein
MDSEAEERIKFLNHGPWIAKGRRAWRVISERPGGSSEHIERRQRQLRLLLRPHWEGEIDREEGLVRDSFDEALTVYQLYELAVETGYIQLEDILDRVYRELKDLLWSKGARQYLRDYSYSGVAYLAQRVTLDLGYKRIELPPVRRGEEGRFASFLSQHALWYQDKVLDGWIGFLDDYQVLNDLDGIDKKVFWSFLTTSEKKFRKEAKLWTFVAGADRLLMRLAGLAESLSTEEKPSYGLFYAYWMAKLYGYDLGNKGFFRHNKQVDWPAALLKSKRLADQLAQVNSLRGAVSDDIKPRDAVALFAQHDRIVRGFWDITRKQFETDPIEFK